MKLTILTSAFNCQEYLDQYTQGISTLRSISEKVDIVLAFGCIGDYSRRELAQISSQISAACREAQIDLYWYESKFEIYPVTINGLIYGTLDKTDYYAIWNLDDVRDPEGLLEQCEMLSADQNLGLVYGDYHAVARIGEVSEQTFQKTYEVGEGHFGECKYGPFITWKSVLNKKLGVYEEQLKSCSDFDWINRLLYYRVKIGKTAQCLGQFLSIGAGISTRPDTPGAREGMFVLDRYLKSRHPCIVNFGKKYLWRTF